jgi:hypothetical protein
MPPSAGITMPHITAPQRGTTAQSITAADNSCPRDIRFPPIADIGL